MDGTIGHEYRSGESALAALESNGAVEVPSERTIRRVTTTLFVTQCLVSAALIGGVTVNPILSVQLGGYEALAGLPGTLTLICAALASYPAGRISDRIGRRGVLTIGLVLGMIGMALAAISAVARSYMPFLLGMMIVGFARGASDQSRFAAAEVRAPARRARAISLIVFGGTAGSIAGPALVDPTGKLAASLGLDPLSGPLFGSALLFALAGIFMFMLLRPDPRDIGRLVAAQQPDAKGHADDLTLVRPFSAILALPQAQLALTSMICGQLVMVFLMSITSLHMNHHHHGLGEISFVIGAHTLGMFGLSIFTGPLADRIGRSTMIGAGAIILAIGALLAPVSTETIPLALSLFLIGLGWNFCYIAGSSLLSETLLPVERGRHQGASDLLTGLSAAAGGLGSGVAFAAIGYGGMSLVGAALALLPLLLVLLRGRAQRSVMADA